MRRWQVLAAACALLWLWTLAGGAQPVAAGPENDLAAGLEAAGQETQSQIDEERPFGDTQGYWTVEDDERWERAKEFARNAGPTLCYLTTGTTTGWLDVSGADPRELTDQERADMNTLLWEEPYADDVYHPDDPDDLRTLQFYVYAAGCADVSIQAVVTCTRAVVDTPGRVHAWPRFGVVGTPVAFWITGTLAAKQYGIELRADPAQTRWTESVGEGIYLNEQGLFEYQDSQGTVTLPCEADRIAGVFDPGYPLGHESTFALGYFDSQRLSSASRPPVLPGDESDTDNSGVYDNPAGDAIERSVIGVGRRVAPETFRQVTYLNFNPYGWDFDGDGRFDFEAVWESDGYGVRPFDDLLQDFEAAYGVSVEPTDIPGDVYERVGATAPSTAVLDDAFAQAPVLWTFEQHGCGVPMFSATSWAPPSWAAASIRPAESDVPSIAIASSRCSAQVQPHRGGAPPPVRA